MTTYYIMAIDTQAGCPAGFYQSVLTTTAVGAEGDYGGLPWYAGPKRYGGRIAPLPEDLLLIEKHAYAYDVRAGSPFFYVVSDAFRECLARLKHNFSEIKPVTCMDAKGIRRNERRVSIAVPGKFLQKDCLDLGASRHSGRTSIELEAIHVRQDWDYDLFDIRDVSTSQASLICSDKARQVFEQASVRCVRYIGLADINASLYPQSGGLYRPVGMYDPV